MKQLKAHCGYSDVILLSCILILLLELVGRNPKDIKMCQELESLNIWLEENKLSLHLRKTENIIFTNNSKLNKVINQSVKCNLFEMSPTNSPKYLGP